MVDRIELTGILTRNKIPINDWENGEAKSLDDLLTEINSGEVILSYEPDIGLIRLLRVVGVNVRYKDDQGLRLLLKEDRQVFKDGRVRRRQLDSFLAEKVKPNEEPVAAGKRAINEELGISGDTQLTIECVVQKLKESQSYPGLKSRYEAHYFNAAIDKSQYKSEGYVEKQPDKSTYFIWQAESAKQVELDS